VQAGARRALNEIILAEDRSHAERAIDVFAADDGVKWPKAVAKVTGEAERLLCCFDSPAEHWVHLRATNPIESSFSPVRARTRVTKGRAPRTPAWRWCSSCSRPPRPLAGGQRSAPGRLVRAGARFEAGKLIERPDQTPDKEAGEDVTKVAA
jgi:hypothetical protein